MAALQGPAAAQRGDPEFNDLVDVLEVRRRRRGKQPLQARTPASVQVTFEAASREAKEHSVAKIVIKKQKERTLLQH